MAVIMISRGSYHRGIEVAEKVAEKLGYGCISREVLLEASKEWNVPEIKLKKAIDNAPSFLGRFTYGRDKYIAFIQSALLKQVRGDDVVYHGVAGQHFVTGVSHALKVRIVADMEQRVQLVIEREGASEEEARRAIAKDDKERSNWARSLYGIEPSDPLNYDLVVRIGKIPVEDAVDLICRTVQSTRFETSPESRKAMDDLVLAAEVKAALVNIKPDIEVTAEDGVVRLRSHADESVEERLFRKLNESASAIDGVKEFKASFLPHSVG